MSDQQSAEPLRVVVWMRELSPPPEDPRETVLARLRELETAGQVDEVSVRVWGKSVPVPEESGDGPRSPVQRRVATFRDWAEREGHSLGPAFRRYEQSTMVSEERNEALRLPLQCLAVYEDERLVGVFPCSTDIKTETVADCLDRLERGELTDSAYLDER
jgi:hypothetical protein